VRIASSNICFSADIFMSQKKEKRSRKRDRKGGGNARCNIPKKIRIIPEHSPGK
jgi:hypothetical protein